MIGGSVESPRDERIMSMTRVRSLLDTGQALVFSWCPDQARFSPAAIVAVRVWPGSLSSTRQVRDGRRQARTEVTCLICLEGGQVTKAVRIYEGSEDDHYRCEQGHLFGMDWHRGPASEPQWPPSPELVAAFRKP